MFGEYESESPRVPSPWEPLISNPWDPPKRSNGTIPTDTHSTSISPQRLSPSPLLLPRLVPENDTGNVEYKLQLLNPSPARFARLVTQLKWRLLEGGGQAYYELGVADSGELVGLPRVDLESSLDTLEMMAGEIGASVIVVKEIEVPAELVFRYQDWGIAGAKRFQKSERGPASLSPDDYESMSVSAYTNTETEDSGTTDCDHEDIQTTVDSEDLGFDTLELDGELSLPPSQYAIDLEISSVYKPRPMRKRFHHIHSDHQYQYLNGQEYTVARLQKKIRRPRVHHSEPLLNDGRFTSVNKSLTRRQARDKRREGRKEALLGTTSREACSEKSPPKIRTDHIISGKDVQAEAETLREAIEELQAGVGLTTPRVPESTVTSLSSVNTKCPASAPVFTIDTSITTRILDPSHDNDCGNRGMSIAPLEVNTKLHSEGPHTKLIVEVLVVRKMSVEEGYLDFEGFSLD